MAKQKTRKRSVKKLKDEVLEALSSVPKDLSGAAFIQTSSSPVSMEEVLERPNMQAALKRVISNKGCAGADGMSLEDLPGFLRENWLEVRAALIQGRYRPGNVKRAYIPKIDGTKRSLGIPTVLDRLIQQALAQKLTSYFDKKFSDNSFGFRPGRSCHQAMRKVKQIVLEGNDYVVDLDLEKFFDEVNHERLMSRLAHELDDKRILKLVHGYLKAGILEGGLTTTPDKGTPQGVPLSPLLSNIVLDELDTELTRRGHKFVRYADDCNIFVKSHRAGERVMESLAGFIEQKLRLKVNRSKSATGPVTTRSFLGFSLSKGKEAKIRIAEKSIKRFKDKVRDLTKKGRSIDNTIAKLSEYLRGWMGYFVLGEWRSVLKSLDQWIRRRLRMLHLKKWRKPRTRFREFRRLGMSENDAWFLIRTTKRYWYLSKSQALNRTLNLEYFRRKALFSLEDKYELQAN